MAAVVIHSDFRDLEKEICPCFPFFPFYVPWSDGARCHDLKFFNVEFHVSFSLSSFTLIKKFFSSSWLSTIRVVPSAYLRLLIFLPGILIPVCNSSSLAFFMVCSEYKLNKQSDNKQPYLTHFSILNKSVVPYRVLSVASWPTHRFLRRLVRWSCTQSLL